VTVLKHGAHADSDPSLTYRSGNPTGGSRSWYRPSGGSDPDWDRYDPR